MNLTLVSLHPSDAFLPLHYSLHRSAPYDNDSPPPRRADNASRGGDVSEGRRNESRSRNLRSMLLRLQEDSYGAHGGGSTDAGEV